MSGASAKNKAPKAQWDPTMVKILCDSCVEKIIAGNRTTEKESVTLTSLGWSNLIIKFNARANKEYVKK